MEVKKRRNFSFIWIQVVFPITLIQNVVSVSNDSFITQGDPLIIDCPRDDTIFSHSDISRLLFHWDISTFHEGKPMTLVSNNTNFPPEQTALSNTLETIFPNGTLYIAAVHDGRHMGEYQCLIADQSAPKEIVKSAQSFDVYISKPPEITPRMQNVTVDYNETQRLRCSALGNAPTITFYVDGVEIEKLHILSDQADYRFTKSAWVTCIARNQLGIDNSTAYFSVMADEDNAMFECKEVSLASKSCSRYLNGPISDTTFRWRPHLGRNGQQLDNLLSSLFNRLQVLVQSNETIEMANSRCLEHFKRYICSQTFPVCSQSHLVKRRPVQEVFVCKEHCLAIRNDFCGESVWQLLLNASFSSNLTRFQFKSSVNMTEDILRRHDCESLTSVFSSTSTSCSPIDLEYGLLSQPVESCYHPVVKRQVSHGSVGKMELPHYAGDFHHTDCVPWNVAETAAHPIFNHYVFPSLKRLQEINSSACRNPGQLFEAPVCLIRDESLNSTNQFITRSCKDEIPKCLLIYSKPPPIDKKDKFLMEGKLIPTIIIIVFTCFFVVALILLIAFCFCVVRAGHGKTKALKTFLHFCCCKGAYDWFFRKLGVHNTFYDYGDPVLYASPEDTLDGPKQGGASMCSHFLNHCVNGNAVTEWELRQELVNIPGESLRPKHVTDLLHPKLRELEYPRNQLQELLHFGEGIYGGVILMEAPNMYYRKQARLQSASSKPEEFLYNNDADECTETGLSASGLYSSTGISGFQHIQAGVGGRLPSGKDLVVLKVLRPEADEKLVSSFFHEAELLVQLNHRNVIGLLGVCFSQKPLCMLQEFMDYGDLKNYLLLFRQDGSHNTTRSLSETMKFTSHPMDRLKRLRLALQIAEGMVYISNKGYVHRDLATRNCLLNSSMCVKISDFMLCVPVAPGVDYIADETESAPIRWIPLESIIERRYNLDTDLWSFGVLLWELFTLAEQPYSHAATTDEVISCLRRNERLPRPSTRDCDDVVYKMMLRCWESERRKRPTFAQLADQLRELTQSSRNADNQTGGVTETSRTASNRPEEVVLLPKPKKTNPVV